MQITQEEYKKLAKRIDYYVISSPSFAHFQRPHGTHLHASTGFNDKNEAVCSFVQRERKVLFYRGFPDWNDWMKK